MTKFSGELGEIPDVIDTFFKTADKTGCQADERDSQAAQLTGDDVMFVDAGGSFGLVYRNFQIKITFTQFFKEKVGNGFRM